MDNEKLLQAISDMMDKKLDERLKPVNDRLDKMDSRLDVLELKLDRTAKKVDDLQIDVAVAERGIKREIHELKDEMETVVEVLKMNELIPR